MEKKIKSLQACVVILAIALCACIYKINALESNIKNLDNAFDRQYQQVTNQVQSIYQNVDEKLREEASLLSSVEAEYGEFDLEKLCNSFLFFFISSKGMHEQSASQRYKCYFQRSHEDVSSREG